MAQMKSQHERALLQLKDKVELLEGKMEQLEGKSSRLQGQVDSLKGQVESLREESVRRDLSTAEGLREELESGLEERKAEVESKIR